MKEKKKGLSKGVLYSIIVVVVVIVIAGSIAAYYLTKKPTVTPTTVTLYVSLAPNEYNYYKTVLVPQFEASHPYIKLNVVQFSASSDEANEVITLEESKKVGNLLVQIDNMVVGSLLYGSNGTVQSGYAMNLTPYVSSFTPSTLLPTVQHIINYQLKAYGGIYFVPIRLNVPLVFYNETVFRKYNLTPPQDWSELYTTAEMIYNKTGVLPINFQGHGGASTPTELFQWMTQAGGNPILFNDSGDVYAFEYLYNLSKYFSPRYTSGYWGSYKGLINGIYYILDYQWPYIWGVMQSENVNMSNIGVYPGPKGPVNAAHLAGGDVLVIPKGVSNLTAVEIVAGYLLSSEAQHGMLLNLQWPVVNSAAYQNLPSNMSILYNALLNSMNEGLVFRPPVPWISEWNTLMDQAWTQIIVNHAPYSKIPSILSYYNQQLYNYLKTSVSPQVAQAYESGYYGPLVG